MLKKVTADIYVMVDGDDTYPAESVVHLITPILRDEADMVVGQRLSEYSNSAFRSFHIFGNKLVCNLINFIFSADLQDPMSGHRVFTRDLAVELPVIAFGFDVETGTTTATEAHKDWQVLEIGCGSNPRGSVNMDVYIPDPLPPNFILGSAELVPFRPKSFDLLTSQFVIEHVLEPARFITSQVLRARQMVEIITDNSEWIGETWFRAFGTGRIFHDEHC